MSLGAAVATVSCGPGEAVVSFRRTSTTESPARTARVSLTTRHDADCSAANSTSSSATVASPERPAAGRPRRGPGPGPRRGRRWTAVRYRTEKPAAKPATGAIRRAVTGRRREGGEASVSSGQPAHATGDVARGASRMAAVAGGARVLVSRDPAVLAVDLRLVRMLVTKDALEGLVVGRVLVALRAGAPLAAVLARIDREVGAVVVEGRGPPGGGGVAGLRTGWGSPRPGGWGSWCGCSRSVAGDAGGGRARVAASDVALGAVDALVRAGQGEAGLVVIDVRGPPGRSWCGSSGRWWGSRPGGSGWWCRCSWPGGTRRSRWGCPRSGRRRGTARSRRAGARR